MPTAQKGNENMAKKMGAPIASAENVQNATKPSQNTAKLLENQNPGLLKPVLGIRTVNNSKVDDRITRLSLGSVTGATLRFPLLSSESVAVPNMGSGIPSRSSA